MTMKKEFLDHLYEQRALVQAEIDRLVEQCKLPGYKCCDEMSHSSGPKDALNVRSEQIYGINLNIEAYLSIHK